MPVVFNGPRNTIAVSAVFNSLVAATPVSVPIPAEANEAQLSFVGTGDITATVQDAALSTLQIHYFTLSSLNRGKFCIPRGAAFISLVSTATAGSVINYVIELED